MFVGFGFDVEASKLVFRPSLAAVVVLSAWVFSFSPARLGDAVMLLFALLLESLLMLARREPLAAGVLLRDESASSDASGAIGLMSSKRSG